MPEPTTGADPRLTPALALDRVCTGVTTTTDGRVFLCFPGADRAGPQVVEALPDGGQRPYPDGAWNDGPAGRHPDHHFVRVNSLRVGPDGRLWIVDAGAPGLGAPQVPGGARLIAVDVQTGQVTRAHPLTAAVREDSYVDDVRFNGALAYLTDAGSPGLIVLDLATGTPRRVLDGHPSTRGRRMIADGTVLRDPGGAEVVLHADQLEVSPDGRYLYYQPPSGGLSRIETRCLDDPAAPAEEVARHVEPWADTPTTGGTAIDRAGTTYVSDVERRRILMGSPDRRVTTMIADPRLDWVDAMWIDTTGDLRLPAAQLNRTPGLAAGRQCVDYPVWIYRMSGRAGPGPVDHP